MKAEFGPDQFRPVELSSSLLQRFDETKLLADGVKFNRTIFGPGEIARIGELARELGARHALVVTDPGLAAVGHPQRAAQFLRDAGIHVGTFDGVQENPTTRHVAAGVQAARDHRTDLLVAVGGGSAMDVAKGINFILTNGGQMADYQGFGKATKPMLSSIGVPTTAGTGSEAQAYALIADEKTHVKMACGDYKAAFHIAILDPDLTLTQPARVTAVTGIDAITHALESFVCTKANEESRDISRKAWLHLSGCFDAVLKTPDNLTARAGMQRGAHLAGWAIQNSMLGAAHACSNPLTAHYGIVHGIAVGVMLPHVIRFNAPTAGEQYSLFAKDANALADRVTAWLRAAQLPTTLRELNVDENILPVLANEAETQWTGKFNPRPVSEDDFLKLYQAAL